MFDYLNLSFRNLKNHDLIIISSTKNLYILAIPQFSSNKRFLLNQHCISLIKDIIFKIIRYIMKFASILPKTQGFINTIGNHFIILILGKVIFSLDKYETRNSVNMSFQFANNFSFQIPYFNDPILSSSDKYLSIATSRDICDFIKMCFL